MKVSKMLTQMAAVILVAFLILTSLVIAAPKTARLNEQVRAINFSKAVPGQLNYQGYLADVADSSAVTATLEMTFRLFDSETKGAELWVETHPAVDVTNGLFQVQLGSMAPFPPGLFDGTGMWLQTEVGTEVFAPRKPLVSVAYSHRSNSAEKLLDLTLVDLDDRWVNEGQANSVTSDMIVDGPGSGLDADMVDGQHASDFISMDDLDHLDAADGDPSDAVHVDNDGKVGIGTATPGTELEVNGAVTAATYWGDGSNLTGISGTADADWTVVGNDMYSAVPGNVGIGRTSPAHLLDTPGPVRIGDDSHTLSSHVGLGIIAQDATSSSIPLAIINPSLDYILYARGDGNVGIGTANPTSPLTIQTIVGTDVEFVTSGSNADMVAPVQFNLGTSGPFNLHLMTNNQNRLAITGTGDVGIGTTTPGTELEVNGAVTAATYWGDGSNLTGIAGAPDADWTVNGDTIYHDTGPVGIGTTSPSYPLHVYNYAGYSPALAGYFNAVGHEFTGTAHAVYAVAAADDENAYGIYSTATSTFGTAFAGYFDDGNVVVANGRLGIGTASPTAELDVNGQARIRTLPSGSGTDLVADGSGNIMFKSSSRRYKKNIRELELSPETVLDLQPVRFQYKRTGQEDIGLIAEEVDHVAPDLVIYDLQGRPNAVKYDRVTLYLLELAREQQERIERLEDTIREMKDR